MYKVLRILLLSCLLLGMTISTVGAEQLVTQFTADVAREFFGRAGLNYETKIDSEGGNYYTIKLSGWMVHIFTYNENYDIRMVAGYEGKYDIQRVNKWNNSKIYPRAYLSKDGHLRIDYFVSLSGGVSYENLERVLEKFRAGNQACLSYCNKPTVRTPKIDT